MLGEVWPNLASGPGRSELLGALYAWHLFDPSDPEFPHQCGV